MNELNKKEILLLKQILKMKNLKKINLWISMGVLSVDYTRWNKISGLGDKIYELEFRGMIKITKEKVMNWTYNTIKTPWPL